MTKINPNFQLLANNYLFAETASRKKKFQLAHPEAKLIPMGIGDVTLPVFPSVVAAMQKAVAEMGRAETMRGYAPEQGYDFLREIIAGEAYQKRGLAITADEIFISDGAKSDCSNILDLFDGNNKIALCDPIYPVYMDTAILTGRREQLVFLPCKEENGFWPDIPKEKVDLIWICSPNNPTGCAATREQLRPWVDYALKNDAVILFDGAYEAFITRPEVPHSIYEIPGAEKCAIEFRSFSKTAGFTGVRCAYTVFPKTLVKDGAVLRDLWFRRQSTKFNGVSYIVQRGAEAVFSEAGQQEQEAAIGYYLENARIARSILEPLGLVACGGEDSPYTWIRLPKGMDSWSAFDLLLEKVHVVTTPGAGFGRCGEGYLRITAFGNPEDTAEACRRIAELLSRYGKA